MPDPIAKFGESPFAAMHNNPVRFHDALGLNTNTDTTYTATSEVIPVVRATRIDNSSNSQTGGQSSSSSSGENESQDSGSGKSRDGISLYPNSWAIGITYTSEGDNVGHTVAWDRITNTIYEIQHPDNGQVNGFNSWIGGGWKSQGYSWNMSSPAENSAFWNFRGGKHRIEWYGLQVPFPSKATAYFESQVGKQYHYNLLLSNCKSYINKGVGKGFTGTARSSHLGGMGPIPNLQRHQFMRYLQGGNPQIWFTDYNPYTY